MGPTKLATWLTRAKKGIAQNVLPLRGENTSEVKVFDT